MLEMEREVSDLVIVAHESVLRVLCAYFMENSADVWTPVPWGSPYTLGFPLYPEIPCLQNGCLVVCGFGDGFMHSRYPHFLPTEFSFEDNRLR